MKSSRSKTQPETWSFFTGAMGLDLGLELAGVQSTLAVELSDSCCATMSRNRPRLDIWHTDIRKVDAAALSTRRAGRDEVFLMVGGPPCQSFCPGGKRAALSDPRGNLIYTYLKLIGDVRPRYFVLENVANLVTAALRHRPIAKRPGKNWNLSAYSHSRGHRHDGAERMAPDELSGSAIRQVVLDMSDLGYAINLGVVDAADFGAPQHRLRFVMMGAREGSAPEFPLPTHGPNSPGQVPWRTVRDAIFDLRDHPGPHSEYTPDVARYFELVPPGGNWRNLPGDIQREALGHASYSAGGGKTGFFRRLAWDRPAPTITGRANRKGSALCHPESTRPLSVSECARLQGFPDDWSFFGSMSDQYMQVGNAVPVCLGLAVGRTLLQHDRSPRREPVSRRMEDLLAAAVARLRAAARNKKAGKIVPRRQLALFPSFSASPVA